MRLPILLNDHQNSDSTVSVGRTAWRGNFSIKLWQCILPIGDNSRHWLADRMTVAEIGVNQAHDPATTSPPKVHSTQM